MGAVARGGSASARAARERHRTYLQVISEFVERRGRAPRVRELADLLGVSSTSTVQHTLQQMRSLGLLPRDVTAVTDADVAAVTAVQRQAALAAALQECRDTGAPINAAALTAALTATGWRLERLPGAALTSDQPHTDDRTPATVATANRSARW
jgi:SOS-response transcriptional repressor LexA